ncbi:carboxylesterase/lipase family protein [Pseudofrankia inefficax]|uniref:Carboxylesterase type B n=1 Tax=Pseudofrankia inefficax (strain DSM 45817 / CECT 9037 / DDB 130130 / EuI1c) TaxID=298654 RepID=E3J2J9_PSEI1|nr:carboxylesterase family protein [Pseudofrankia inefficax]ADP80513.1 Carboxylesterase type B [Pseudofrankia inefficax]
MFRSLAATVLAAFLLTLPAAACSSTAASGSPPAPSCDAKTSLGAVAGRGEGGLCAFLGIPYAQPPTGRLRFRPPVPVGPWHGTLPATDGTHVCPQDRDSAEDYPDDSAVYTDEDCLYLNVWTPRPDATRRPVIVFIHGGAARLGSADEPRYDGAGLARAGNAVVISLNYRLGILGWSELGGIDPSYEGSGNNGLRDQLTALRWVQAHVADFGGDPSNVTVAGQSEGAFSISAMLATDHPEKLFQRAVLESGSGYLVHSAGFEKSISAGLPVKRIEDLTAMSTSQILGLQDKLLGAAPGAQSALYFAPYVDGTLVREPTIQAVEEGKTRDISILLGTTRDEMNFFGQFDSDGLAVLAQQYDAVFPARLAGRRDQMVADYRRDLPGASDQDIRLAMFTDQALRVPALRLAEAQSRWRPTYVYEFDWKPPTGLGAVHTIELPFVFGTLRFAGVPGGEAAVRADRAPLARLSAQIMDAWTSFARTGDPNAVRQVSRPTWPSYQPSRRATMIWDAPTSHVVDAPRDAERAAWDAYPFAPLGS